MPLRGDRWQSLESASGASSNYKKCFALLTVSSMAGATKGGFVYRIYYVLILTCFVIASLGVERAESEEIASNADAEIAAIRAAADAYAEAVRSGHVDVLRRAWTPEGDYIDASGQRFKANELLPQEPPAPSKSGARDVARSEAPPSTVRLITPSVAIEDGSTEMGVLGDGRSVSGRFTAVWVKHDGRWRLDSLREAVSQSASTNDRLQPLSWLLGEWAGVADDQAIVVSSNWSDSGNYLIREFAVHGESEDVVTGTERIGWDPVTSQIKSWSFDSQGGRGESTWNRDGERWIVESAKVMPDGKTAKVVSTYTPRKGGAFTWEVSRASVADKQLPPLLIEFKRAADE